MTRRRARRSTATTFTPPRNLREALALVDLREVITAVLVVSAVMIGSRAAPWLFAKAEDIVITQAFFEFPMALLALFAGYAEARSSRLGRGVILLAGAAFVLLAGGAELMKDGSLGVLIPGLWVVYARIAPPPGVEWFTAIHVKLVGVTAATAWTVLIAALALLMLLNSAAPAAGKTDEAQAWVYALAWGGYYLALAVILPAVRRRHLPQPKSAPATVLTGLARLRQRRNARVSASTPG
ncbi:MAG: hypothetical protein JNL89_14320 [Rhodanobacteraceae bacterium]|nr:hypothetical protein [Rhodanobacteraceae bacterium]